ncbi:MAG: PIN domain-containing protein [Leptolyngbyaceae cyanobacterium RU_5_1]|nr:PIN domain-containing protein [Leptolyngbyaceae cyanobacterium RU_5_1]
MILIDTGPLVALIDKGQGDVHIRCVEAYQQLTGSLLTTWPCFTEAMYFLSELRGWSGQSVLWQFLDRKVLHLHYANEVECYRIKVLMEKYQDIPMDLADASLVSAAENCNLRRIFTLDSDFYIYRLYDKDAFEVLP